MPSRRRDPAARPESVGFLRIVFSAYLGEFRGIRAPHVELRRHAEHHGLRQVRGVLALVYVRIDETGQERLPLCVDVFHGRGRLLEARERSQVRDRSIDSDDVRRRLEPSSVEYAHVA